jgi:hypothetical protein
MSTIIGVYSGFARLLFAASVSGQPLFDRRRVLR